MGKIRSMRSRWLSAAVIMAIWICCESISASGQQAAESVIVPGVGVGALALGDPIDATFKKLGMRKATAAWESGSGAGKEVSLQYQDMGMTLVFDSGKSLKQIIVTSPGLLVERSGVQVGGNSTEVIKSYGARDRIIKPLSKSKEM